MPFLNMGGISRQMKDAFKVSRLKIGAFPNDLVVGTHGCIIAIKEGEEPNKLRGLITEYMGYVPIHDPSTRNAGFIELGKDQNARSLEAKETEALNSVIYTKKKLDCFIKTPLIIESPSGTLVRVIQNTETAECMGIEEYYMNMMSYKDLDYDREGEPIGPMVDPALHMAYFTNSTCRMVLSTYRFSTKMQERLLKTLKFVDLREEQ